MKCHGLHNLTPTYPSNCVSCSSLITYPMFYLQCGREVFQNYWTSCLEGTKSFPWKLSAWRILPPLRCSTTQISQLCGAIPNNTPSPSRYILPLYGHSLQWTVSIMTFNTLQNKNMCKCLATPLFQPPKGRVVFIHQCPYPLSSYLAYNRCCSKDSSVPIWLVILRREVSLEIAPSTKALVQYIVMTDHL